MLNGMHAMGSLAAGDPKLRRVLDRVGIDYVCCGNSTLAEAAAVAGRSVLEVQRELEREPDNPSRQVWADRSLGSIVAHLSVEHRNALNPLLSRISMLLEVLADPEMTSQPAFWALRTHFAALKAKLALHSEREDGSVFPQIQAMESAWIRGGEAPQQFESGLRRTVATLYMQHAGIVSDLKTIRRERERLQCEALHPECVYLIDQLAKLEQQLHEAMNLENFVLYPGAIALEDQLYSAREPALA